VQRRLRDHHPNGPSPYENISAPTDLKSAEALKEISPYQFEWWAVDLVNARYRGRRWLPSKIREYELPRACSRGGGLNSREPVSRAIADRAHGEHDRHLDEDAYDRGQGCP
jgi:hypothetical protein